MVTVSLIQKGGRKVKIGKKKVLGSGALATSLIVVTFMTLLTVTSAPALIVMAKQGPPGTYEIDIYGDASGLYSMCEMFQHFSAMKLEWSASVPSYPSGYVNIALDVRNIDFDKVNEWTCHLSLKGLDEFSISSTGYAIFMFYVKARSGELNLAFSNPSPYYPYYYRTLDITGTLKGDTHFHVNAPPTIPEFHYEGPELTIHVHIGM